MKRMMALLPVLLSLAGCGELGLPGSGSGPLQAVEYHFVFSTAVVERYMTISPDGEISAVEQTGNQEKDWKKTSGHLSPEQRQELLQAFRNWGSLKSEYQITFPGPIIDITYGGKKVQAAGNENSPKEFRNAVLVLDRIASSVLQGGTTRPASTR